MPRFARFKNHWFAAWTARRTAALLLMTVLLAACDLRLNPTSLPTSIVELPFGQTQVSFNEIIYDSRLQRIIVPAAETGALAIIDPATQDITQVIQGFTGRADNSGESAIGATSAAVAKGMIFVPDQAARKINIVDPESGQIVGSTETEAPPHDIRFVSATNEIWVTEPDKQQIEVFKITANQPPNLEKADPIQVPDGPEGLLIDRMRGLAYTNRPDAGATAVIQVITHGVLFNWGNGCSKARGMAIDENEGYLFVACNEGKVVMMDIEKSGAQITSQNYGGDLDFLAYNPQKKHLYLPSGASAIVAIFAIVDSSTLPTATADPEATPTVSGDIASTLVPPSRFALKRLGTADTALKASCITVDDQNNIWVCDRNKGRLFLIHDSFPAGG